MPVKFTDRALGQVLLRAGYVVARGQIGDDLLADPAALEDARLGVGEAPFQVGHDAGVGRLLTQVVGVLQVELLVGAACFRLESALCIFLSGAQVLTWGREIPNMRPPFPSLLMGWPFLNWSPSRGVREGAAKAEAARPRRIEAARMTNNGKKKNIPSILFTAYQSGRGKGGSAVLFIAPLQLHLHVNGILHCQQLARLI